MQEGVCCTSSFPSPEHTHNAPTVWGPLLQGLLCTLPLPALPSTSHSPLYSSFYLQSVAAWTERFRPDVEAAVMEVTGGCAPADACTRSCLLRPHGALQACMLARAPFSLGAAHEPTAHTAFPGCGAQPFPRASTPNARSTDTLLLPTSPSSSCNPSNQSAASAAALALQA